MAQPAKSITLYHYTTEKGKRGIADSKLLRASEDTRLDTAFGKGVYFTSMSPKEGPDRILENNYGQNRANKGPENIEWVVEISISELLVHKVEPRLCDMRDIYRSNFPMYLGNYRHRIYRNPALGK